MALTINYNCIRITLAAFSSISGLIFMSKSSFFDAQFDDTKTSEIFVFTVLSALLVFLVFANPSWNDILQKVRTLNSPVKATVDSLFLGIVWLLAFLIKFPRFDFHSRYIGSCPVEDHGKKVSHGSQYNLYSVGAFALLSLLLSLDRQKSLELGFFGILIGLIMDTAMEIPSSDDEPNFWYILGSILYCIGLIFFKRYMQSLEDNGKDYLAVPDRSKRHKSAGLRDTIRNSLVYFSAIVGMVCLFLSPFSEQQFEDAANVKAICFIAFSLLLGSFLLKAPIFIDYLVMKCEGQFLVKAVVKSFLFLIVSGVIFMTKYPRFKIHSHYRESCKEGSGKTFYQGNKFDVCSTGSFSLLALIMSSRREQPVKLGIFSFLLELTMDTSIEILGNDQPNFLCVLGAALYCSSLLLVKSYLDSSEEGRDNSFESHRRDEDRLEIAMVSNVRDESYVDEEPLTERKTGEEKGVENEDYEWSTRKTEVTPVVARGDNDISREDADSGDEPSASAVYGAPSRVGDRIQLLSRTERQIAKKREKAKRERRRKREKRNEKEDLWIA